MSRETVFVGSAVAGMDDDLDEGMVGSSVQPGALASPPTGFELPTTEDGDVELVEARWREMLRIDPESLNDEFYRIPNQIAYLAAVHARAIGEHLRAKARAKRMGGLLRIRAREELIAAGAKPTESQVEARADNMPEMIAVQEEEFAAEVAREEAKGRVAGAIAKRDMLVQLGANVRKEMEHDPVIRDRARAGRDGGYG